MSKYHCSDCIVMPVCSEACDKLHRLRISDSWDIAVLYTHIIEGKYCPDCGCAEGFIITCSATHTIVCSKCTSSFTSLDFTISSGGLSRHTVMRHWKKGGLFNEGDEFVNLITFAKFIKGIKGIR